MNCVISWYVLTLQSKVLSEVSRNGLPHSLVMNKLLGSVWEKFELNLISFCFLELLSAEYLHEINISIFVSQNGYLFFRYLESVFQEETNKNKERNS